MFFMIATHAGADERISAFTQIGDFIATVRISNRACIGFLDLNIGKRHWLAGISIQYRSANAPSTILRRQDKWQTTD